MFIGVPGERATPPVASRSPRRFADVRWVAETGQIGEGGADVLLAVLGTDISPELVPGDSNHGPEQKTESAIGPYELQDFHLYYITRFGLPPSKVAFLAWHAWRDAGIGPWPPQFPDAAKHAYDLAAVRKWLRVFLVRFFAQSQFKRSALPNSPKVVSGGSLSPRGDWRAPSDGNANVWLAELDAKVPE